MSEALTLAPVAHIRSDFPTKFGIPRQSGLVESLRAAVVFTPEYRNPDALRGLEGFSHLWLVWVFPARWVPAGPPPSGRPGWGATSAWGSLPPAPPSGPTPSASPP